MKKKILERLLRFLAKFVLAKYKPKIVAITGSAGKSTTKELVFLVLSRKYKVFRNYASLNNEIGVPLTVFLIDWRPGRSLKNWLSVFLRALSLLLPCDKLKASLPPYPQILVLETGVEMPGDMDYLLAFIQPFIGVFTVIGNQPAHLQFFKNAEEVIAEKGKLIESLPAGGLAVLNRDDGRIWALGNKTKAKILGFGQIQTADCQVGQISFDNGLTIELTIFSKEKISISLPHSLNETLASNIAAALLVGSFFEVPTDQMKTAIEQFEDLPGRMKRYYSESKNLTIIDDSYNASPVSYKKLIETVKKFSKTKKIAVFADVLEADSMAKEIHEEIARLADGIFSHVALIGPRLKLFAQPVFKQSVVSTFEAYDFDSVVSFLSATAATGDVIVFKGARAFHLEKIIQKFIPEPIQLAECYCDYRPGTHRFEFLY